MLEDRFGLPLSTDSPEAVEAYVSGLDLLLSANTGAEALLDEAIQCDPNFALAHIARARMLQLSGRVPEAKAAADTAQETASKLLDRERGHIRTVTLAVGGKSVNAFDLLTEHVTEFPRDALPLSLTLGVYGLLGFSGRIDHHEAQLDLLKSLAPHWDDDWWFTTYFGTAHVECGNHRDGITLLEQALAKNPRNGHAAHGRAHGYYEVGDVDGGISFLTGWLPDYDRASQLHCHLSWHLAAFLLHQGDIEQVTELFNDSIRLDACPSPSIFAFVDNASLLWRSALNGYPFGQNEIREVKNFANEKVPRPAPLAFFNIHIALALATAGDDDALQFHLNHVDELVADGRLASGQVVSEICHGIASFGRQQYEQAAECLEVAQKELDRIWGSHAQRDVVIDSLIVAYLRLGEPEKAEKIMRERADKRASHLDRPWLNRIQFDKEK
jgi:tetratricopeptide (TPR) repeat protein